MNPINDLGDLSSFSPTLQQWLRLQVERAERDPEWIPTAPLPPGSSVDDAIEVSSWLMARYHERIRQRRELERFHDIPEFVL